MPALVAGIHGSSQPSHAPAMINCMFSVLARHGRDPRNQAALEIPCPADAPDVHVGEPRYQLPDAPPPPKLPPPLDPLSLSLSREPPPLNPLSRELRSPLQPPALPPQFHWTP
jgi:hypothetical protein